MSESFRILIIDDSPEDLELYSRLLLQDPDHDYTVIVAESGKEGIEVCRAAHPHCVLLDYRLPDADGLDVLADLVRDHTMPDAPVVMMTGQGSYEIDVEAIKVGAQDYLVKDGLTGPVLWRTIRHSVERHRLVVALKKELVYRAQLEHELQASEAKARAIVEIAWDAIITFDKEGKIETFNPTAESLFGYRAADVIGQNVSTLMPSLLGSQGGDCSGEPGSEPTKVRTTGRRNSGGTFNAEATVSVLAFGERRLCTCVVRSLEKRKAAV